MDCMVDLETLDNTSTSAIASISAVVFDPLGEGYGDTFRVNVSVESALEHGTYSEETIDWWAKQSEEARNALFDPEPIDLKDALLGLHAFVQDNNIRWIWACSPRFDMVILEHAYKAFGMRLPKKYWDEMDVRTLKMIMPKEALPERTGHHTALGDCLYQIELVQLFFRVIFGEE